MNRIAIYPKDIMLILDICEKTSRKKYNEVRKKLNKEKGQVLTIKEFCIENKMMDVYEDVLNLLSGK